MKNAFWGLRVPYGERGGKLLPPNMVPSGLLCGCRCPGCGALLVRKLRSDSGRYFFAHHNAPECPGGVETALHKMAKQIIQEAGVIRLPDPVFMHSNLAGANEYAPMTETLSLASVQLETGAGMWIPDITARTASGEILYIEIFVTHAVEAEKAEALNNLFEIDLSHIGPSDIQDAERLKQLVLFHAERRWYRVSRYDAQVNHALSEKHGEVLTFLDHMKGGANVQQHHAILKHDDAYGDAQAWLSRKAAEPAFKGVDTPGRYVDVPTKNDWIFGVHRLCWQSHLLFKELLTLRSGTRITALEAYETLQQRFGMHPVVPQLEAMTDFEMMSLGLATEECVDIGELAVEHYLTYLTSPGEGEGTRTVILRAKAASFFLIRNSISGDYIRQAPINLGSSRIRRSYVPPDTTTDRQVIPPHLVDYVKAGIKYVSACRRCKNTVGMPVKRCGSCQSTDIDVQYLGKYASFL